MLPRRVISSSLIVLSLASACSSRSSPHAAERSAIEQVAVTDHWDLPTLQHPAHVVFVEGGIPNVYAANEHDAMVISGFLHARDRYVQMELTRRFGEGRLSELVGDAALPADLEARGRGSSVIVDRLLAQLSNEEAGLLDAYAEGINAYVAELQADPLGTRLPVPTELKKLGLLLPVTTYADLMQPMTRRDVVAMLTAVLFNSSFTSDDLTRQQVLDGIPDLFTAAPNAALREAGARDDLFDWVEPVYGVASANGFGLTTTASLERELLPKRARSIPRDVLARAVAVAERFDRRRRGPRGTESGSNAWAIGSRGTPTGNTLLAGDGHLPLSVPSLLYPMALDTTVYGGAGSLHLLGLFMPGIPMMPIGTNGEVAFSFTYLYGDLVDWYAEEIGLDASGRPATSRFQGQDRPLVAADETYTIADVPALGSVGRSETWARYATFDGRVLASIEGTPATATTVPGPGEALVTMLGDFVIPGDVDGDGVVSAISFDYTGFDVSNLVRALRAADRARTVEEFGEAQRSFVGFAQNFVASDRTGSVYYDGYTATPCRTHLPRVGAGAAARFAPGADPRLLLDGTQYGAFTIPVGADNRADESQGATDPSRCVVPFDRWPHAIDPASGYVLTANNDLGGLAFDGSLANDEYYLGGPWEPGYRSRTIAQTLAAHVTAKDGSVEAMAALQAEHTSPLAIDLVPFLLDTADAVRALATPSTPEETALRAAYDARAAEIDDATGRLSSWLARGAHAASGVETFYDTPTATDREDAVATMIWNAWFRALNARIFDDEGVDAILAIDSRFMRATSLNRFLRGRGPGNPENLASYDPATGESVFFDDATTAEVETSRQILLAALVDALDALEAPETAPGEGGFGTSDASRWLWGLRHAVQFPSLITAYAGDVAGVSIIANSVRISTSQLPLAPGLSAGDPRFGMLWFPRPGDWFAVDAANPPTRGPDYAYSSGPVMRMVIELGPSGFVRGQNIVPGGQSGVAGSPHFSDQAALWLGNRAYPMHWTVADVIAHATAHETFE